LSEDGQDSWVARVRGVTQIYGKAVALDNVSIDIPAHKMIGLIGPDGVGKSTLLGMLAGVRKIQTGDVEVLGGNIADARFRTEVSGRIAYLPQGLGKNLYPTLSIFENADFFGRLFGQSKEEREWRIDDLFASTDLTPFKDRPAGKLSGGMKQKLGLCCSLIHDPDLLILDEPTTGVDPLARRQFWELIDRIRIRRPTMSVLVATAYMDEAERFDWLVAMNAGTVIGTGTPEEVRNRAHENTLEKAFIKMLPEEARRGHKEPVITPYVPSDGPPVIEAHGLTQRFGAFTAVDHVNFRIEPGEIFGFLGSNGCGKTTTMKMLTGLLPPTEGTALLNGQPVKGGDVESRRNVGFMTQAFSLYTELTVRQNLMLHARLFDYPEDDCKRRVEGLLEKFGLQNVAGVLAFGMVVVMAIVMGVLRAEGPPSNTRYFNSVLALGDTVGWYDKHHLVPFAEFFPVPHFVRSWLRLMSLPYSDFTRGAASQPPLAAANLKLGATICYEDAYGSSMLRVLPGADALVNVTNDAWFGHSSARHQHLQISRMRALEAGRYMVRAANDGISGVIGPHGEVIARAPEFVPVPLVSKIVPMKGLTPYAYVGNWLVVSLAALALAYGLWVRNDRRRRP